MTRQRMCDDLYGNLLLLQKQYNPTVNMSVLSVLFLYLFFFHLGVYPSPVLLPHFLLSAFCLQTPSRLSIAGFIIAIGLIALSTCPDKHRFYGIHDMLLGMPASEIRNLIRMSLADCVHSWALFPDSNANTNVTASRKMILHSQLYGPAKVCGDAIDDAVLCFNDGVDATIDALFKVDPHFVGKAPHSEYAKLISIRGSSIRTYGSYKDRLSAVLPKLNFIEESVLVSDKVAARSLVYNANINLPQLLGVM